MDERGTRPRLRPQASNVRPHINYETPQDASMNATNILPAHNGKQRLQGPESLLAARGQYAIPVTRVEDANM